MVLIASLYTVALLSVAMASSHDDCSAFSIDGPNPATFSFYRFYDFRNASTLGHLPTGDPAAEDRKEPDTLAVSKLTNDSSWTDDWRVTIKYQGQASEKVLARHYVADHVYMGIFRTRFSTCRSALTPDCQTSQMTRPNCRCTQTG